jgi:predicted phosphate transport protein (TIGR00153 family)
MSNPIGALFGRSPIKPIQEHMGKVQDCVVLLGDFLDASFEEDWKTAKKVYKAISIAENAADDIKRDIRSHLPKSLFLPVARSDLLGLLSNQDRIADRAKEIAGLMLGRKIVIPESLVEFTRQNYQNALNTSAQAVKAINELDELLETGFRGKEAEFVESLIAELEKLENKSDLSQAHLRKQLFKIEDSLPPVHAMFLYKIIDLTEEIADISYKLGGSLLLLVAR